MAARKKKIIPAIPRYSLGVDEPTLEIVALRLVDVGTLHIQTASRLSNLSEVVRLLKADAIKEAAEKVKAEIFHHKDRAEFIAKQYRLTQFQMMTITELRQMLKFTPETWPIVSRAIWAIDNCDAEWWFALQNNTMKQIAETMAELEL